ncbi:major facilitator superfamily transporter [Histomonas meleagridis]|uniref:major facilitator superfamily transporter n=1 Tax=Histomonas meleagridis TaxID=135588 RepID=UPI00355A901A|nr:major facilitator superfamily transporter [Histomonas meleagridis]KAH0801046.1 major facilitator superfamily transporter [Histomonas meleagridis]
MSTYTEVLNDFPGFDDSLNTDVGYIPLASRDHIPIIHIVGICCSMLAYQIAYSVEFALGTPIMKRLGVSQVAASIIWFSGPLSGLIVQPLIGYYSDISRFKLGRRRPYIIIGGVGIIIGFLLLYFVEQIGSLFGSAEHAMSIFVFIIALLETNISINILQGPSRAILGDIIPQSQQVLSNTIGSLMLGLAAIITNLIGGLKLGDKTNGVFTNDELTIIVGVILIIIGILITLFCGKEEPLLEVPIRENPFKEIFKAIKNIPRPVLRISLVYFFSWMAYFPFQTTTTDFFGSDIYGGVADSEDPTVFQLYEDGKAFGMLVIAISNFLVLLYSFVQSAIIKLLGLKLSYSISQIIEALVLIPVFFVKNKWVLLGLLAPLGISCTIFNSVPFAVVGMIIPLEQMGTYMGVLNCFAVLGQQCSSFLLGSGVGALSNKKGPIIGSGSAFAIVAAVLCYWIIVPQENNEINEELLRSDPIK